MFTMILATDRNRALGLNNSLPWHVPEDLRHFREKTRNKTIVMGNSTFRGLKAPLKNRHTVVISRHIPVDYQENDLYSYCTDFDSYLIENRDSEEEIVICGGKSIYLKALPYVQRIYLSLIPGEHEADTWIRELDLSDFCLAEEEKKEDFVLQTYIRKTEQEKSPE